MLNVNEAGKEGKAKGWERILVYLFPKKPEQNQVCYALCSCYNYLLGYLMPVLKNRYMCSISLLEVPIVIYISFLYSNNSGKIFPANRSKKTEN